MGEIGRLSSYRNLRFLALPWKFTLLVGFSAVVLWPFSSPSMANIPGLAFTFLSLSVASMTGIWVALTKPWWRYFVALLVILIGGVALMTGTGDTEVAVFLIPFLIAAPIAATLETIKLLFGRFAQTKNPDSEFSEGLQFGISHLLIVTTVVAVLCTVGKAVAPMFDISIGYRGVIYVSIIVSIIAFNTLVSIWALLGAKPVWRIGISLVTAVLLILIGGFFSPSGLPGIWIVMFSVVWVVNTILLVLLRRERYRFVSKKERASFPS